MARQRTPHPAAPDLQSEDALAFKRAVRDVKPLPPTVLPKGLVKPKRSARVATSREATVPDEVLPLFHAAARGEPAADGAMSGSDALSFRRSGVRLPVMRRLRRGLIPIDAELDLHGLSQSAARDELVEFLDGARGSGHRCVHIVHGKGLRSGTRGPVLKMAVDHWLRHHPDVLAFTSARAVDGGTGALYVLLKG